MSDLEVTFMDEAHRIGVSEALTFGRSADLEIDANRHLHRVLGRFENLDGVWWLLNVGSAIGLDVLDTNSSSRLSLAPGTDIPLPFQDFRVLFSAGRSNYEIEATVLQQRPAFAASDVTSSGNTTVTAAEATLNDEQRLLLTALAEQRLETGLVLELPANKEIASRLGWTVKKFDRKLDNLCTKFDRLGVSGLKGDQGGLATNRRNRLVDHVITVGLITADDLALLELQ